jgi:hypothetical protein
VAHLVEILRYKPEGRGLIPDGVIGIFFIGILLPTALCSSVDSASKKNQHQGYFPGGGGG